MLPIVLPQHDVNSFDSSDDCCHYVYGHTALSPEVEPKASDNVSLQWILLP
jgi:hypothetical protein